MPRIWIVTVGEPLPTDSGHPRLLRSGILARLLATRGWDVVWWTSDFDHVHKSHRTGRDATFDVQPGMTIRTLHSVGYRRNVSVWRLLNHSGIARKFRRLTGAEAPPDLILSSLPTLELSLAAVEYGRSHGVPVVVDARDRWPDIFVDVAPRPVRGVARALMAPLFRDLRRVCSGATALTGHTEPFVDWAVRAAQRQRSALDRAFPFGYSAEEPDGAAVEEANRWWDRLGVTAERFVVCFFGTIGRQFDFESLISAARIAGDRITFVLCGAGDRAEPYREASRDLPNVIWPGWVRAPQIWSLMRRSAVGVAPYIGSSDFADSIPNKIIEYLSAGLPIVSTLPGVVEKLLSDFNCGITVPARRPDAIAAALLRLADDPALRQLMGVNAHALYTSTFTAENVYTNMAEYLEMLVHNQQKSRNGEELNECR